MAAPSDNERYVNVPTFIFKDRSIAALEAIVVYLKESQGMNYSQIAKLLNRDQRTIWTTYNRARQKLDASGQPDSDAAHKHALAEREQHNVVPRSSDVAKRAVPRRGGAR